MLTLLAACGVGQPKIDWGKAECAHCRMNVMDQHFGAAIITTKGRQYVFDSPECMVHFVTGGAGATAEVANYHVADHAHPGTLIDATKAFYLHADDLRSPMGGNCAAFATAADREAAAKEHTGEALDWEGAKALLAKN
jgi:copper chaperone NosL